MKPTKCPVREKKNEARKVKKEGRRESDMYWEIFLADFAVSRVFLGILRDFAEIPEFRGSATARNIRSPVFDKM